MRPDPEPADLAPVFVVGAYADALRRMLIAHKEHRVFGLSEPLGRLLAIAVEEAIRTGPEVGQGRVLVLVPVPSSRRAVRARGHDPVVRMVRAAAEELCSRGQQAVAVELLRQRRTPADQAGLDAGQRARNLAGALRIDPPTHRRIAGRLVTVVLCDDIVTTGSTAREAQRALAAVGIAIAAITAVAATEKRRGEDPRLRGLLPNC